MQEKLGAILRQQREKVGLSIEEVSLKLASVGKKISPKTLYGYENDVSSPKISVFMELCNLYQVYDIYETFHVRPPAKSSAVQLLLSNHERALILSYRQHPEMQSAVDTLLHLSDQALEFKNA